MAAVMVSDWSNSAYIQCCRDRAAQAQVIVDHGQRIVALEAENGKLRLELADLWAFVREVDLDAAMLFDGTTEEAHEAIERLRQARAALRQYEEGTPA